MLRVSPTLSLYSWRHMDEIALDRNGNWTKKRIEGRNRILNTKVKQTLFNLKLELILQFHFYVDTFTEKPLTLLQNFRIIKDDFTLLSKFHYYGIEKI